MPKTHPAPKSPKPSAPSKPAPSQKSRQTAKPAGASNLTKLINKAAPVLLQGNYDDSNLYFKEAVQFAKGHEPKGDGLGTGLNTPRLRAPGANMAVGPKALSVEVGGVAGAKSAIRQKVKDQVNVQLEYLMKAGGMKRKEAMKSLRAFYAQANDDRLLKFGKGGHSNRTFKNNEIVGAIMQNPALQQPGVNPQTEYIDPYVQQLQAQNLSFADYYEQQMYDKALRIKDPNRQAVALTSISDYANQLRANAMNLPERIASPYGGKDSVGYLLSRGQQGMATMLNQLSPTVSTAVSDPFAGGGDFASQVMGMMPEENVDSASYMTSQPTAYYGGGVDVNTLSQQQPQQGGYYGPFASGYFTAS